LNLQHRICQFSKKIETHQKIALTSNPTNVWMEPSELELFKHRRREDNPNISVSYAGSSWQIAEYKHKIDDAIWISKIPGLHFQELLREIIGAIVYSNLGITTAQARITQVPIFKDVITTYLQPTHHFAIASKKFFDIHLIGEKGLNQLLIKNNNKNELLELNGISNIDDLWEMLAIAHWIGDCDCIGASGKNAGFYVCNDERNPNNKSKKAKIVKFDTGYFLQSDISKLTSKDIWISPRDIISINSLQNNEKKLFLRKIKQILELDDNFIAQMANICVNSSTEIPKLLLSFDLQNFISNIASNLIERKNMLKDVFKNDL